MNSSTDINPYAARGENARKVLQRDRTPLILRPYPMRGITARNRIVLSPMCQYCATDGLPDDWHFQTLASRAVGGAGIVFAEATAVTAEGRATPFDLGLYNDAQQTAFARIAGFVAATGAIPAIQLVHSGRKSSTSHPAEGGAPITLENGGWEPIAPSATPFREGSLIPRAMEAGDIAKTVADFAASAARAREAGFKILEIHAAHGYLIHQFLSPLSNQRQDDYGGSFDNRIRFLREIVAAVRVEWPEDLPLFVRISATDWVEGGWEIADSVALAQVLRADGRVDLVDCSSGALSPAQKIKIFPGYQVHLSRAVREGAGIATGAVGLINSAELAEYVLQSEGADLIFIGRGMLGDPYWPIRAAKELRTNIPWPQQYERGDIY